MRFVRSLALLSLLSILSSACVVTRGTHEKAISDLNKRNDDAQKKAEEQDQQGKAKIAEVEKQLADTQAKLKETEQKLAETQRLLGEATKARDGLSKKLDEALQAHTGERSQLFQQVEEAKKQLDAAGKQLDELNRAKAAAEARAETYRSLTKKLRAMTDAGQLKVKIREGRMIIALPNDVLFDSGKAALKTEGKDALAQLAGVLKSFTDRKFQVAGHTDNDPIKTARFPSNWELSTARAVDVTRFLVDQGLDPKQVSAVGYGEFDPVAPNESDEGKRQNRRIEITLQPNISDLPAMDEAR